MKGDTDSLAAPVSVLLRAWGHGSIEARDQLLPLVYRELRKQAGQFLRRERQDHTLQPTALVHEAYLRLIDQRTVAWQDRAHFFAIAAQAMRRILVDHARRHRAAKRAGGLRVEWADDLVEVQPRDHDLLAIDRALTELARLDARQARVVELRFFGGLSEQEVAHALGLSRMTIAREWNSAKAWLYRRMTKGPDVS